jgi:hypothetical protein
LNKYRKPFEPIDKEIKYFLPTKLFQSLQKRGFGIRDQRSGIWKKSLSRIKDPDPGVKNAPDPNTGHIQQEVNPYLDDHTRQNFSYIT